MYILSSRFVYRISGAMPAAPAGAHANNMVGRVVDRISAGDDAKQVGLSQNDDSKNKCGGKTGGHFANIFVFTHAKRGLQCMLNSRFFFFRNHKN